MIEVNLEEFIDLINNNRSYIFRADWKEATRGFSQDCLEQIMKGINDLYVLEEVTWLIKCEAKMYDPLNDLRYTFAKYKYKDPTTPDGEIIECDLYHFLHHWSVKRKRMRMRDLMMDATRCNATPTSDHSDEEIEESTLQNVQRNVFTDDDAKAIWERLIELGYIDKDIKPVNLSLSMMRAVVKAFYYAWDKENLSWVPFKERWGKDLQHAKDSQESEKLCEQLKCKL